MYPARMEVILPVVKLMAVYGKLVGATVAYISRRSTVDPRIMAKIAVQITR